MPVSKPFSALRSAASADCAPNWRLSSLRAILSSTVCMRAAVTPSKLKMSSKISATNMTTPLCFERLLPEKELRMTVLLGQCVSHGDSFFNDLARTSVDRGGGRGAKQVVGKGNRRRIGRSRSARREQGDLDAHDGVEVGDLIGGDVICDVLGFVRVHAVQNLHRLDIGYQFSGGQWECGEGIEIRNPKRGIGIGSRSDEINHGIDRRHLRARRK